MKLITHKIPVGSKIWNLGDVHWASPECDRNMVLRATEEIASDPLAYWVSTGDLFDVNIRSGKHLSLGAMNVAQELDQMAIHFDKIAGKCLGIVKSNHHHRVEKETSLCLDELFLLKLGLPAELALGYTGVLRLVADSGQKMSWLVCMHHGTGGGRLRGSKAVALERLEHVVYGCDIFLEGHTHTFQYFVNNNHSVDPQNHKIISKLATYATTGHFLSYGGYAEREKMRPSPKGCIVITLNVDGSAKKRVDVKFWS